MPKVKKSQSKTLRRKPSNKKTHRKKPKKTRVSKRKKKGGTMSALTKMKLNNFLRNRGYSDYQIMRMTHEERVRLAKNIMENERLANSMPYAPTTPINY